MATPLRLLLVEDSEEDALLLTRELRHGGYQPVTERVDTEREFDAALDRGIWDLVVCDYKMPHFDGPTALEVFKRKNIDIPFIIVSGMIGEDVAVEMMRAGAHDYLLKHNLARLVPAIERELREAEDRREHRQAERARSHLAAIVHSSEDGIISTTLEGSILSWNLGAEKMFGYTYLQAKGRSAEFCFDPEHRNRLQDSLRRVLSGEPVPRFTTACHHKDGRAIDVSFTLSPIRDVDGSISGASLIARDITERKKADAEREKLLRKLQEALAQVKALSGLLPICASCKKIRDDEGYWHQVEIFIQRHSEAEFTHGFCPECLKRLYPQFVDAGEHHPECELHGRNPKRS